MSPDWSILPLLPLRCVMEHLSLEDAMAAMSTCRHWRSAMLLYEGRKELLRLSAKHLERSLFVARVFRKHIRRLHIYLDCKEEDILDDFMSYVLPIFFDTLKLRELVFIGPSYIQKNHFVPVVKLKRIVTESLIFKNLRSLQRLALMGCEMEIAKGDTKNLTPHHLLNEYYSRPLSFSRVLRPGNMNFSLLQHLLVDYEHINTEALETLSQLAAFTHLTLNVGYKQKLEYAPIDWTCVDACYPKRLKVSVNIVSLPHTKMDEIIENVLGEGMLLVSLKVMFCKILYAPLLEHVVRAHKLTLQELVWADCPYNCSDVYHRHVRPMRTAQYDVNNVNPFILLCWQCPRLRRLAIHGYWIWQYDLLGFVRLSRSLEQLQVSAIHDKQDEYGKTTPRVLALDQQPPLHQQFVEEVNQYTKFTWTPTPWASLHPALRAFATPNLRSDFVVRETLRALPSSPPDALPPDV